MVREDLVSSAVVFLQDPSGKTLGLLCSIRFTFKIVPERDHGRASYPYSVYKHGYADLN
jgi:hypothetical protein